MGTHGHGANAPTALTSPNEYSWAWHHYTITLIVPLDHTYQCSWVFMSAHEGLWVLLSAPYYSLIILSIQVLDSVINKKCWFYERLPFSILTISQSRFQQMIANFIVLKSTLKGLLNNVQNGPSRGFRGREINKTKVETILRDTLYL